MNKYNAVTKFQNAYHRLKEQQLEEFSELANQLLSHCFITAKKVHQRNDYFAIVSMLPIFQNYFEIIDYELHHYESDEVLHLVNKHDTHLMSFKKGETILLLILRKMYYLKQKEISLQDDIVVKMGDVHEELMRTGLFDKRIGKTELKEMIAKFKRFHLLDNVGKLEQDDTILILYPTMLYVIAYQDMKEIDDRLSTYQKGEPEDEMFEEDSFD